MSVIKKLQRLLIFMMVLTVGFGVYLYMLSQENISVYNPDYGFLENKTRGEKQSIILILKKCSSDSDCSLEITNCCPETAGANWECINLKKSKIECESDILCPQILSPKPNFVCTCKEGGCVAE